MMLQFVSGVKLKANKKWEYELSPIREEIFHGWECEYFKAILACQSCITVFPPRKTCDIIIFWWMYRGLRMLWFPRFHE